MNRVWPGVCLAAVLAGCLAIGDSKVPIGTLSVAAPLLYEREHPGELTGIVLFAPFLGSGKLLREIRAAGGPRKWDPGPLPAEMDAENYQRQVWKMVKGWADRPELARRVWLACGTSDHLIDDVRLLAPELPEAHYLELPGGHTWSLWLSGAKEVFSRIRLESMGAPRSASS